MTNISAEKRELLGKKAKKLKAEGKTPAVLYNSKGDSHALKVDSGVAIKLVRDSNTATIFEIDIDGKKVKALLKDVDFDPIKETINHLSFFEIDESQVMTFEIPVVLEGVSPAVKNNLGILVQPTQTVEVRCKLSDLIPSIVVNISQLDQVGQTITLADITLPEGIALLHKDQTDRALAAVTQLQKSLEAELAEEAEKAAAEGEDTEGEDGESTEGEAAEGGDAATEVA